MSSYLTIKWADAKPDNMVKPPAAATPAARMQMAVDSFACVQQASAKKMPSMLFVFSEQKVKRDLGVRALFNPDKAKPANEELTEAAKRSLAVYERVFDNVQDIPLRILLRFFQCTRMDVTKVPDGLHPDIAEASAPLVLIVDAQGKVAQVLSQTRIDSRSLTMGMVDVLKKGGLRDVETLCASSVKLMDEMENALVVKGKIEIKMSELKTNLSSYEAKDLKRPNKTGKPLPPSSSTLRAKQAVDALQVTLDAAERNYEAVKEKDAAMLKNAGVDLTAWQKAIAPTAATSVATSGTTVPATRSWSPGATLPSTATAPAARSWSPTAGTTAGGATASTPTRSWSPTAGTAAGAPGAAAEPTVRTWTSASGKTLQGRFAQLELNTVTLAKPDGTTVQIPIDKLSPGDQAVVRQLTANP